jgi:hypothetical protein
MDTSVLPELIELVQNYVRGLSDIISHKPPSFCTSLVKVSMTSLSCLSMLNEVQTAKMVSLGDLKKTFHLLFLRTEKEINGILSL